jgi:hypothetical protein
MLAIPQLAFPMVMRSARTKDRNMDIDFSGLSLTGCLEGPVKKYHQITIMGNPAENCFAGMPIPYIFKVWSLPSSSQ